MKRREYNLILKKIFYAEDMNKSILIFLKHKNTIGNNLGHEQFFKTNKKRI